MIVLEKNMGPNGLPPDLLPQMGIVSPSLRRNIQDGKEINLQT